MALDYKGTCSFNFETGALGIRAVICKDAILRHAQVVCQLVISRTFYPLVISFYVRNIIYNQLERKWNHDLFDGITTKIGSDSVTQFGWYSVQWIPSCNSCNVTHFHWEIPFVTRIMTENARKYGLIRRIILYRNFPLDIAIAYSLYCYSFNQTIQTQAELSS